MATLVLQYAGAALGTMLGGPIGGIIGRAAGALAGNMLDQSFFGGGTKHIEGPRLSDTRVMSSTEGAPVPRLWGRARLAGQVIWATSLEEVTETTTDGAGGKGGPKTEHVSYSYFANFAVALCEGPVSRIGRAWADGKEIDLSDVLWRLHRGSETQEPDSLIVAKEGESNAPAYRGIAYVVFERLPLVDFGNRIPQLAFEVVKPAGGAEDNVRAVNIIPGSTEFGYDTKVFTEALGDDETRALNSTAASSASDWTVSLDDLTATCRNLEYASLVVAWFANDLRCGVCSIRPGVETTQKDTEPEAWGVAGTSRSEAHVVSQHNGGPAYGGTPTDASVIRALRDLTHRGLKPVFYPFVLMDIAAGNSLPNPDGGISQPVYPWRGRITCHPAPGRSGSPDGTAACAAQIADFLGTAQRSDFSIHGDDVTYSGPSGWGYRRMILHYAHLCKIAGDVEAFLIGSELRGLTWLRGSGNSFPFVDALRDLAADVKAILPQAKVSYAADWSEYFGLQPQDGSGDVFFHLDPLWADGSVDFVGIDNYMPLTDWRDGSSHLDRQQATSIYDIDYLQSRIAGGEGFDWYYASQSQRDAQMRTPITDGAYGKPWVFRYKDIAAWWSNHHYNRPAGVESTSHTGWVPQSKPIWFTETGCAAIDKGTNQPNCFLDPKSAESLMPLYSRGQRDDYLQNRFIIAVDEYWSAPGAHNPVSAVYGGPMVDHRHIFMWAWDARPFPDFPQRADLWSDGDNYARGHWLNGRVSAVPLPTLLVRVCHDYGLSDVTTTRADGLVDGFVIDRVMTGREALEALCGAFAIDAVETGSALAFRSRKAATRMAIAPEERVELEASEPLHRLTRAQEIDLPRALKLSFVESAQTYRRAAVEAACASGGSASEVLVDLPCVISEEQAQARAEIALHERWSGRETLELSLPPRFARLEPGDVIDVELPGGSGAFRIDGVTDSESRKITARSYDPDVYDATGAPGRVVTRPIAPRPGKPDVVFMDLPLAEAGMRPAVPWVAASAKPWVGPLVLSRYVSDSATVFNRLIERRATKGRLLESLSDGPRDCFDRGNSLTVKLDYGALQSVSDEALLQGANLAAVGSTANGWEILQFGRADLVSPNTYALSFLLRGQMGSDPEMLPLRAAGSRFVLLNPGVVQPVLSADQGGLEIRWQAAPRKQISTLNTRIITHDGQRLGLRPLSPCQLRMARDAGGFSFSWIRRTRLDGDSWEAEDVPLNEEREAYIVDILDGATVKRSTTATSAQFNYSNAAFLADFPSTPAQFSLRIQQLSATYGRGAPLLRIINV